MCGPKPPSGILTKMNLDSLTSKFEALTLAKLFPSTLVQKGVVGNSIITCYASMKLNHCLFLIDDVSTSM